MSDFFSKNPLNYEDVFTISKKRTWESIFDVLEDKKRENILSETGPYTCMVLYTVDMKNRSRFKYKIPDDYQIEENSIAFYIRNDTIHASIENPLNYPEDSLTRKNIIELHPLVFTYSEEPIGDGDFVLIDFKDRKNFTQPFFVQNLAQLPGATISNDFDKMPRSTGPYANSKKKAFQNICVPNFSSLNSDNLLGTTQKGKEISINESKCNKGKYMEFVEEKFGKLLARKFGSDWQNNIDDFRANNIKQSALYLSIIQNYWKQAGNADVKCTSLVRLGSSTSMHFTGMAMDLEIYLDGKKLPVQKVYASLKNMIENGLIPDGGLGLYLNVEGVLSGQNKIFYTRPSTSHGGQGASESCHYDWRGTHLLSQFGGPQGVPNIYPKNPYKKKPARWVWFDLDGDGKDDIYSDHGRKYWDGDPKAHGWKIKRSKIKEYFPEAYNLVWGKGHLQVDGVPIIL